MASIASSPRAPMSAASDKTAGMTWEPGWPLANLLPSSNSNATAVVPKIQAAASIFVVNSTPGIGTGPSVFGHTLNRAWYSGSCAPAALTVSKSARTNLCRSFTDSGTRLGVSPCTHAATCKVCATVIGSTATTCLNRLGGPAHRLTDECLALRTRFFRFP